MPGSALGSPLVAPTAAAVDWVSALLYNSSLARHRCSFAVARAIAPLLSWPWQEFYSSSLLLLPFSLTMLFYCIHHPHLLHLKSCHPTTSPTLHTGGTKGLHQHPIKSIMKSSSKLLEGPSICYSKRKMTL